MSSIVVVNITDRISQSFFDILSSSFKILVKMDDGLQILVFDRIYDVVIADRRARDHHGDEDDC